MRNSVTFQHPSELVPPRDEEAILAPDQANWFVALLRRVDGLSISGKTCEEDWGATVFAERAGKSFWIGLSLWPKDGTGWLAHFHHGSFSWFQGWTAAGRQELQRLISDFHTVLASEPAIRGIAWYHGNDRRKTVASGSSTPNAA